LRAASFFAFPNRATDDQRLNNEELTTLPVIRFRH